MRPAPPARRPLLLSALALLALGLASFVLFARSSLGRQQEVAGRVMTGADSDLDGCADQAERSPNAALGGRRDPANPWDFFDTPSPVKDRRVSVADIYGVVAHFGFVGDPVRPKPPYHPDFDRSPPPPDGDPWDTGPPDGSVGTPDLLAVVAQIGHVCAVQPSALPDHFFLGLSNRPEELGWMTDSGVPWDARYQYLTADWSRWNSPTGQFALNYLRRSGEHGYLPVFTYYRLVPLSGYDEGAGLLATLRNANLMIAYYDDFRLLLLKAAEYGGPVIIHLEPDVWGHLEQRSETALARSLAQHLVTLRDQLAPNVILAYHASPWGSGVDVALNNNTSLDVTAAARRDAAFYHDLHANFDLIFSEVSDRDAAYYELVRGSRRRWWSDANFARYHEYLAALSAGTGKPIVVWQIPMGNTMYRSVNNTPEHWQDNRVQTWLTPEGMGGLKAAGVIGLLFGGGADDQTKYTDSAGDGITNPTPVNGNDGVAQFPDDDGGLLRLRAAAYYRYWGPLPLP